MKNISKSNLELNKKIQENLNILNELLSQAHKEGLVVKISNNIKANGIDGYAECSYFEQIEINLLVQL